MSWPGGRSPGGQEGPGDAHAPLTVASGGIAVGDNHGIISTGPNATNIMVQLRVQGEVAQYRPVAALEARPVPVLGTFREREPVGREALIGHVAGELAAGVSVQLHGAPGVGKKAVARAVIRRLADGPAPARGIEVSPQGGQPHTLDSVYEFLTAAFFTSVTYAPAGQQLRAAAAAAQLAAVVVIDDCELPPDDVTRLLGTFPGCTFLLTSARQTLFRAGAVHEVSPLAAAVAAELIGQEAGPALGGLEQLQVDQAITMAGGQVQRLLQLAAFLRRARDRPGQDRLSLVPPLEQAKLLATGLSEPARRVLVSLRALGTELPAGLLPALTGLPVRPAAGPDAPQAGAELLAAALVTCTPVAGSGAGVVGQVAYRLTADAAALLLAIAGLHSDAGLHLEASRFTRAAMPAALRAGQVRAWSRLLIGGLQAATAAGAAHDLGYFLHEDRTRIVLERHKAAITAAAAAGLATAAHQGLPAVSQPARQLRRGLRHAARLHAKAITASHPTAVIGAAVGGVAVAAAVAAGVIIARPGPPPPLQWTGTQLAAALLPLSDFPGYQESLSISSGPALVTRLDASHPTKASCEVKFGQGIPSSTISKELGTTAFAFNTFLSSAIRNSGTGYASYTESIYQFASPASAAALFSAMHDCLPGVNPRSGAVDTAPVDGNQAFTATLLPAANKGSFSASLLVLHGTDVFSLAAASSQNVGPTTIPRPAQLIAELIARVEALGRPPSGSSSP